MSIAFFCFTFSKKNMKSRIYFHVLWIWKQKEILNFFFSADFFCVRSIWGNYQITRGIGGFACRSFSENFQLFASFRPSSAHQVISVVFLVCKKFQNICQNQSLVPDKYLCINGENMEEWGHQKVVKMRQILF